MRRIKRFILSIFVVLLFLFPYQAFAVKVVIDPGHGGKDPGAIGVTKLQEKQVNFDTSVKLRNELLKRGYEVAMTRTTDVYMSLQDRVAFANRANADLFVSIHANSYQSPNIYGTMVLYYDRNYPQADYPASPEMTALTPESKKLATYVLQNVVKQAGTYNKGIIPSAVYVVRKGTIPSILIETGFLSNPRDESLLKLESFKNQLAMGIANGIEAYFPPLFPDTAGHWARAAILRLKDKGIMEGSNNRFQPNESLTRAQFMSVMNKLFPFSERLAGEGGTGDSSLYVPGDTSNESANIEVNVQSTEPGFNDLHENHWAYNVLNNAVKLGYMTGYPDHTIRPDEPITRAEVAVLFEKIWKTDQAAADPLQFRFADVPDNTWYTTAVYLLKNNNIMNGTADNLFSPERSMTRAEAAAMMDNFITQIEP